MTVGYPEEAKSTTESAPPNYYNSAVTVSPSEEIIVNYRKSFLYYTDETWAAEGPGFYSGEIANLGNISMGICELPILLFKACLVLND